jgi:drug/metabolite transporter (DMT)-like permease
MWGVLAFYTTSALFYISDVVQKKTSENRNGWTFIFFRSIFTFLVTTIIALFFNEPLSELSLPSILQMMASCLICMLGLYFYLRSVKVNRFANVGALSLVGNPIQWLLGWIIFNEEVVFWDIPIMLLLSFGSILQLSVKTSFEGAKWVVLSSLSWTIGYAWLSNVIDHFPLAWSVAVMEGVLVLGSGVIVMWKGDLKKRDWVIDRAWSLRMMLLGVVIFLASYCNHFSYRENDLSWVSILQLTTFPIYYLLSLRIFKEKPDTREWITFMTAFLGLLGVVLKAYWW